MKLVLKISAAVILSLLFLGMAASYFTLYAIRTKGSNPDFYKKQLHENDIYERTYTVILPSIIKPKKTGDANNLYGGLQNSFSLSDADIETLGRRLINKEDFLIPNVEQALDSSFDYLNNKTDTLNLSVDLTSIKTSAPGVLTDFAIELFSKLPECSADKRLVVNDLILLTRGTIPSCFNDVSVDAQTRSGVKTATGIDLPATVTRNNFQPLVRPSIETQARTSVSLLPNRLDLIDEIANSDNRTRGEVLTDFDDARTAFGFSTGWGIVILVILMLAALVAIYFLLRNSPVEPLAWIGITVTLAGAAALITSLIARSRLLRLVRDQDFTESNPELSLMIRDLTSSIIRSFASGVAFQSLFFLIGGIVIIGVSVYVIMKRKALKAS